MRQPLVSVCLITYNHEKFIAQAIESVLMQKVNFGWEFIIADDCSTDRTREIIKQYKAKHPFIKLILQEKNVGPAQNFDDLIKSPTGKYIAYFEGDDYWTDSLKLQKQVDFLEANPDFAICFHKVGVKCEVDDEKSYISNQNQKEITTFEDLTVKNYIHSLSCVFRNNLFGDFPEWFKESPLGDYPLHLLNAMHGKIKFFDDLMGVYRVHQGGIWSLQGREKGSLDFMKTIEFCKNHFAPRGEEEFSKMIDESLTTLCFISFENGKYKDCRYYYLKCIKSIWRRNLRTTLNLTVRFLLSYSPNLSRIFRKLRTNSTTFSEVEF